MRIVSCPKIFESDLTPGIISPFHDRFFFFVVRYKAGRLKGESWFFPVIPQF
jgi:hypothetical protein